MGYVCSGGESLRLRHGVGFLGWVWALSGFFTSIDCERPDKGSLLGITDEAGGLQRRVHKVRWVNEGPKAFACEPPPKVLQSNHDSHVPAVSGDPMVRTQDTAQGWFVRAQSRY